MNVDTLNQKIEEIIEITKTQPEIMDDGRFKVFRISDRFIVGVRKIGRLSE